MRGRIVKTALAALQYSATSARCAKQMKSREKSMRQSVEVLVTDGGKIDQVHAAVIRQATRAFTAVDDNLMTARREA